jgi:ubiquinone/menaquinone biosynthesis C-methylase UbiE
VSDFRRLHDTWESLGQRDPLWAILSTPESRGNRWDEAEFFRTGEDEVARLFDRLNGLRISIERGRALDFGCGVGRVTRAFATRFDRVDGVDIAPSMIRFADEHNGNTDRCWYHTNRSPNLRLFESNTFDFVYSRIVLMHIPPRFTKQYITEFSRILRPGGLAVFHVPSSMPPIRRAIYETAVLRRRLIGRFAKVLGSRQGSDVATSAADQPSQADYKHAMYFIRKVKIHELLRRSGMDLICTEERDTGDVHDVLYYSRRVTSLSSD